MLDCLYFSFFLDIFRYENVSGNCEFAGHLRSDSDVLLGVPKCNCIYTRPEKGVTL